MKLNELPKFSVYSKSTKRKGKGVGSGHGKTAGRGHKGGKARAGYSPAPCCSGIPFYRHLPIRGFSNARFRVELVNIDVQRLLGLGRDVVDKQVMLELGLIKSPDSIVKVLGIAKGSPKATTIVADKFSKAASASLASVGCKAVSLLGTSQNR